MDCGLLISPATLTESDTRYMQSACELGLHAHMLVWDVSGMRMTRCVCETNFCTDPDYLSRTKPNNMCVRCMMQVCASLHLDR